MSAHLERAEQDHLADLAELEARHNRCPTCDAPKGWVGPLAHHLACEGKRNTRAPGVTVTREEIARAIYEAIVPPESDAMPFVRMNGALSDVDIDGSFDLLDAADAILSLLRSKT